MGFNDKGFKNWEIKIEGVYQNWGEVMKINRLPHIDKIKTKKKDKIERKKQRGKVKHLPPFHAEVISKSILPSQERMKPLSSKTFIPNPSMLGGAS